MICFSILYNNLVNLIIVYYENHHMNPQEIDDQNNYITALKQQHAQIVQQLQNTLKEKDEEIKSLKLTAKPIKNVKA